VSGRHSANSMHAVRQLVLRPIRTSLLTIRGKILLAFLVLAAITFTLGRSAVNSVVESGRLVVQTYDRPLMSISYARLAQANFTEMRLNLALREGATEPEKREQLATRLNELAKSVRDDLDVAEERASSRNAINAARQALTDFEAWDALRLSRSDDTATRDALHRQAEVILQSLDNLGELTAEDGFRDRERALRSIETYRRLSIAFTVAALVLSMIIAVLLARRMVRPIAAASRAARRIAAGELDTEIIHAGSDELGQLLGAMSLMRDNIRSMVEREIAERRSAQAQLVDAIESSAEGLALVDADRRILIANSQMAAFFPDEASGLAPGSTLPRACDSALTLPTAELRLADGRWLRLSRSNTENGGFVLIASDITLLKEREDVLRNAKEQADRANRLKTDFLTNMSHELRTPLSAIIGFSEMIAKETLGSIGKPKYREFAEDILLSGRHLLDIIGEILDVAKLQAGTMEIRPRLIHPRSIVDGSVRIVRKQAQEAGVTLSVAMVDDVPMVMGDPLRLRQVLLNLLSNAIKFTPSGKSVTVAVVKSREAIRFEVRDNGIGMAAADIPRALEPFGQVDTSLSRLHGGTGLGLPLSKLLVERHGSAMTVESEPGKGTTVWFTLPIVLPTVSGRPLENVL
jgi:signal transduction histidine kinase/HAMP domain-containing protein